MFTTLRTLLALQMSLPNWIARLGDVSTAFLYAPIAKHHDDKQRYVYLWPPKERCPLQNKLWRLKKAMYELRSSPKAWQDYLAEVLQKLNFVRLKKSEPSVYTLQLATVGTWRQDYCRLHLRGHSAGTTQAHWLPRAWQTTTVPGRKH